MGVFDLFGKDQKLKNDRTSFGDRRAGVTDDKPTERGPISVFSPSSYKDVEAIIDILKNGRTAVVHVSAIKPETAIRIVDMLSGAVYALGGGVYEVEKNVFMFSPSGVEMK